MKRAADLCTGFRVLLAPVLAWLLAQPRSRGALLALVVFAVAAATDYVDGALARASGSASRRGRVFDHGADALLLFPSFWVLAVAGRLPVALPLAAMTAFGLYVLDGWRRGGGSLGAIELTNSRSGALGGVLNYVIAGAAVIAAVLDVSRIDQAIRAAAFGVAAVNAVAALERLSQFFTTARGSRAAEKEVRAPRSSP
jgi:phosphatidylglycerophosphate synthase